MWMFGELPSSTRITNFAATSHITGPTVGLTLEAEAGTGVTITHYAVTQDSTEPAPDGPWQTEPVTEYTITEGTPEGKVTLYAYVKDSSGFIATAQTDVIYAADPLIPITGRPTRTNDDRYDLVSKMVDGNTATDWFPGGSEAFGWVRVSLASRCEVSSLLYQPALTNQWARIKGYRIYVTDMDSLLQSDWGDPVATGTWADDISEKFASFAPTAGQYVILYGTDSRGGAEMWLFGDESAVQTKVTTFTAAPLCTTTGTVDVAIAAQATEGAEITGYKITQTNEPPAAGGLGWLGEVTEYTLAGGTPEGSVSLYGWAKDDAGNVSGKRVGIVYTTTPEIPKAGKPVVASGDTWGLVAANAIDGNITTRWSHGIANCWIRVSLEEQHSVSSIVYLGYSHVNERIKDYKVYVTDADSTDPLDWGEPVAMGTFPNDIELHLVTFEAKLGSFVILQGVSSYAGPGVAELWMFGRSITAGPTISAFTLADQTTGSTLFTNSADVDVSITIDPEGPAAAAFLITTTADTPDAGAEGWGPAPAAVTLAGEGYATLFAWAKDVEDRVSASASATIYFWTAAPVVSNVLITDNGNDTATATWTTDIPAVSSLTFTAMTGGSTPVTVNEGLRVTSHSVQFSTEAGQNYKIVLTNNEVASPAIYWPQLWPIEGDANGDCRVNILDLIFIRNRLNQDPATGDNWQADVNMDTRINILDLIYVRNRLNNACP